MLHCEYALVILVVFLITGNSGESRNLPFDSPGRQYWGMGALSGGGGTSRLLWDYPKDIQQKILDILFKPNMGANLQILKVEIGGDAQSTEATEASHMHTRHDLNYKRGYEWWLMSEAAKRSGTIKFYGLSWGAPGWIGNHHYYSQDNIDYHVKWLVGAETQWGLQIDYLGIWNEHLWNATWIKQLRQGLDAAGFPYTKIVAADDYGANAWSIIPSMLKDPELLKAVDFVGAHYPYSQGDNFYKDSPPRPLWASECWNLRKVWKQFGDWEGGWELARMLNRNYLQGNITAAIIWNLIYSWYPMLPYASHPHNSPQGEGHSLMYANEPWSGYYSIQPPIYVMGHTTQFTQNDGTWFYIPYDTDRNFLKNGATYVALKTQDKKQVTIVIESTESKTPETITFHLQGFAETSSMTHLNVWQTTQQKPFQKLQALPIFKDGNNVPSINITIPPQSLTTITSISTGGPPPREYYSVHDSQPFPFPYYDNMTQYQVNDIVTYFSDQGGSWQADLDPDGKGGTAFHQVVLFPPIPWGSNPAPCTYIGDYRWTDYTISTKAYIDATPTTSYPHYIVLYNRIGVNSNMNHKFGPDVPDAYYGIAFTNGTVVIHKGPRDIIYTKQGSPLAPNTWHSLSLSTVGSSKVDVKFVVNGNVHQATDSVQPIPNGLAALGSGWHSSYFKDFSVSK